MICSSVPSSKPADLISRPDHPLALDSRARVGCGGRVMTNLKHLALLLGLSTVACGPPVPEACRGSMSPTLAIGSGVGGAFQPFEDNQSVGLTVAPQGGFGVSVVLHTKGLAAGDKLTADATLESLVDGMVSGTFSLTLPLLCQSNGSGGLVSGVVVGFDPARYGSNDALLSLDGKIVVLRVTVTDTEKRKAVVEKPITLKVGG